MPDVPKLDCALCDWPRVLEPNSPVPVLVAVVAGVEDPKSPVAPVPVVLAVEAVAKRPVPVLVEPKRPAPPSEVDPARFEPVVPRPELPSVLVPRPEVPPPSKLLPVPPKRPVPVPYKLVPVLDRPVVLPNRPPDAPVLVPVPNRFEVVFPGIIVPWPGGGFVSRSLML